MNVNPNVNVVLTACLAVYVGCYRLVKPTPPTVSTSDYISYECNHVSIWGTVKPACLNWLLTYFHAFLSQETMSNEHAMRFPLVGSAMLLSLFLLFKFFSKDLVNACLTCYFFLLGILAFSYASSLCS